MLSREDSTSQTSEKCFTQITFFIQSFVISNLGLILLEQAGTVWDYLTGMLMLSLGKVIQGHLVTYWLCSKKLFTKQVPKLQSSSI